MGLHPSRLIALLAWPLILSVDFVDFFSDSRDADIKNTTSHHVYVGPGGLRAACVLACAMRRVFLSDFREGGGMVPPLGGGLEGGGWVWKEGK